VIAYGREAITLVCRAVQQSAMIASRPVAVIQ
jgi:hypothetical protein